MASLLMPTRKACGRYVCHDVCLSAPTVRTLNSTIGPDHDLTVPSSRCHSSISRALRLAVLRRCLINRACYHASVYPHGFPESRQGSRGSSPMIDRVSRLLRNDHRKKFHRNKSRWTINLFSFNYKV